MKVIIEVTGVAPLLMHNVVGADPLHPLAREGKKISNKRKKTEDDYAEMSRIDWHCGIYHDETIGPYLPAENMAKAIVEGGRITKQGKSVERGLLLLDDSPLLYRGPRDLPSLWADASYRNSTIVKVNMSRVVRCRPIFREWQASFEADLDSTVLDLDGLQEIVATAGRMVGLCDRRPRFGRFESIVSRAN